jgi:hypothetical protein
MSPANKNFGGGASFVRRKERSLHLQLGFELDRVEVEFRLDVFGLRNRVIVHTRAMVAQRVGQIPGL